VWDAQYADMEGGGHRRRAVTAGCALVMVKWTVPQLAPFLATLFIARGGLHLVTTSFEGMLGVVMIVDGVAELLLAFDAKRHGDRGAVPLVASS
jgi:hypothetical protein